MVESIDHGLDEKGLLQDLLQFLFVVMKDFLYRQPFMAGGNLAAKTKTSLVVGEKKQLVAGMIGHQLGHPGGDRDNAEACPSKEFDQKVFTDDARLVSRCSSSTALWPSRSRTRAPKIPLPRCRN